MGLALGLALGLVLFALLWLNLLSLPGNWLMLGVLCLVAAVDPQARIAWEFVGGMVLVALCGELFEFFEKCHACYGFSVLIENKNRNFFRFSNKIYDLLPDL